MTADPTDNAWKIHAAIVDWTGKVDTKASFSLTIEAAIVGGIITLSTADRALTHLHGFGKFLNVSGILILLVAIGMVAFVVRPRLRSSSAKADSADTYIYFGHARHWKPDALAERLREDDILPRITKQIVVMSEIAWLKHRLVQWSVPIAGVGALLEGWAALVGPS